MSQFKKLALWCGIESRNQLTLNLINTTAIFRLKKERVEKPYAVTKYFKVF